MKDYVIAGCGVAGVSAAASIRKLDSTGNITIFADEPHLFYTRIRLPQLVAGEIQQEKLVIYPADWYAEQRITVRRNEPVTAIDSRNKQVKTAEGSYAYDYLLLATGSHPFVPPISGVEKQGVFTLRSIRDALAIKEYAQQAQKVVVIGGGLLGLEAGNGLRKDGLKVSIIEFFPRLLPRQMDIPGAEILKKQLQEMGFSFYLGAQTKEILGENRVEGVRLDDGRRIEGDMVLLSAGVRPNIGLAQQLGLQLGRGVVVDDRLQTSISDIFAAGDLVEHRGIFYGIWPASEQQGKAAGINMAGGEALYEGTVPSNVLKVVGIDLVSAGEIDLEGKFEALVKKDAAKYIYRKLIIQDNIIIGCILLGDVRGKRELLAAIDKKKDMGTFKAAIMDEGFDFGRLR
jgi:nitrite reductase (NADH) large subunit